MFLLIFENNRFLKNRLRLHYKLAKTDSSSSSTRTKYAILLHTSQSMLISERYLKFIGGSWLLFVVAKLRRLWEFLKV